MALGFILTPGKWTYIAGGPLSREEKIEKAATAKRYREKFNKKLNHMSKVKASDLMEETLEYAAKLQAEKEFLLRGIAENKVKSKRLLIRGALYKKGSDKNGKHTSS